MTSKRVAFTLTIVTDERSSDIHAEIITALRAGGPAMDIESTHVHAYDLNDETHDAAVHLAIDPVGRIYGIFIDRPESAEVNARTVGGVVVTLPIDQDYRGKEDTDDE